MISYTVLTDRLFFLIEKKCAYCAARTEFLQAFAKLRKATISFVMSVRPSDRPQGITLLPLDACMYVCMYVCILYLCVSVHYVNGH